MAAAKKVLTKDYRLVLNCDTIFLKAFTICSDNDIKQTLGISTKSGKVEESEMRYGETFTLENKLKDQPEKDRGLRAMTEVIAKKNSVRILVNSTGAFPMHPAKLEEPSVNG